MLYALGLPPRFWSSALTHAVYLKNCLWHSAISMTPFEAYSGQQPSLSHLCVFGSKVTARRPGKPAGKLDCHVAHGIFLGYGSTDAHIRYFDISTGQIKLSNHH